jgi:hypothetical protein
MEDCCKARGWIYIIFPTLLTFPWLHPDEEEEEEKEEEEEEE